MVDFHFPKSRTERLERGFRDPVWFNRYYLEAWFPDRVPWFHRGMQAILTRQADFLLDYGEHDKIARHFIWLDDNNEPHPIFIFGDNTVRVEMVPNSNLILPRGFSKTTVVNASNIRDGAFKLIDYGLYISESATHAQDQLGAVRREWEENPLLIADFGTQAADRQDSRRWTNEVIEMKNGCFFRAVGRGGQVRGKQFRAKRPNKIICDDIEDEESILSPDQRKKTKNWYYSAVLPALAPASRRKPGDGVINLGTLLGSECLLREVANDPTFNTVVLGAIDSDGDPLWPEHMSAEAIEIERNQARRTGTLHIFSREKLSTIRQEEDAPFREDMIQHRDIDPNDLAAVAIAIDPAISEKKKSDKFAIAVVGKLIRGQTVLLDIWSKVGVHPFEQVNKVFETRNNWRNTPCGVRFTGVETVAYQKALEYLIREEMAKRNDYFELVPILHGNTDKLTRIKGILQPRYAARMVIHARKFPDLEGLLLDFPNGKLDEIDAFAMGVALLEPFSHLAADPLEEERDPDYADLQTDYARGCP